MVEAESTAIEDRPDISVNVTPITPRSGKPWDRPLRLIIAFVESLGRSSEEFYVYLPHAHQPRSREKLGPIAFH